MVHLLVIHLRLLVITCDKMGDDLGPWSDHWVVLLQIGVAPHVALHVAEHVLLRQHWLWLGLVLGDLLVLTLAET